MLQRARRALFSLPPALPGLSSVLANGLLSPGRPLEERVRQHPFGPSSTAAERLLPSRFAEAAGLPLLPCRKSPDGASARGASGGVSGSDVAVLYRQREAAWRGECFGNMFGAEIVVNQSRHTHNAPGTDRGACPGDDGPNEPAPDPPPPPTTWVDRAFPPAAVPYAKLVRLDAPAGTWLLLWPCLWSLALVRPPRPAAVCSLVVVTRRPAYAQAAPPGSLPDGSLVALFSVGAFLLRGAGCTINDLWDRKLDAQVERTRHRPLAAGTISPAAAVVFLVTQLTAGLAVLLQLNGFSQTLGASSLLLVGAYPAMKRITDWPQAFLGLTFNWGALLGWAAARGSLDPTVALPLYAGGVCWTLVYDTVYAHQDKADDVKAGIKSTALRFGDATPRWLALFASGAVVSFAVAGAAAGLVGADAVPGALLPGVPLFEAGLTAAAAHLAWQIATVNLDDRADCAAKAISQAVRL